MRVSELGEQALIARIADRIGPAPAGEVWSGDDAAVLSWSGAPVLFTTDLLVEGMDFDLSWGSGYDLGWKAVAVNVSDLAAMAGSARAAVVNLSLAPGCELAVVDHLVEGMLAAAARWDVALVGGDISEARELTLSVAMMGTVEPPGPVLRSGARSGDALCVTGSLGGARAGLMALQKRGRVGPATPPAVAQAADRQLRGRARPEAGRLLAEAGATAMIDLSDGLAVDLDHVLRSSGRGCFVDPGLVPVDPSVAFVATWLEEDVDPLTIALTGGEDFELLLTMDPARVEGAGAALGNIGLELTPIGEIRDEGAFIGETELGSLKEAGWEHLRIR